MASQKRLDIANIAETSIRGHRFVSFDVAMHGHLIASIDAPLLSGGIVWSHAAIHGFGNFCLAEQHLIDDQLGSALTPAPSRSGH